mgnify:CR=1 FL=1|tara:strand:- start:274 stop:1545 length:1272 start_codon:yes stop_codon:yes gene_type:complete
MLGLSSGLIHSKYLTGISNPTDVNDLIGWWDFTDASTMYTDAGSTNVSSSGQRIYRIDNKAYTLQNNTTNAIGKYLNTRENLEVFGNPYAPLYQTTDSVTAKRPPAESSSNPISYAHFVPNTYTDGDGDSVEAYPYMRARGNIGNVRDDGDLYARLTDSFIDLQDYTYFTVFRTNSFANSSEALFNIQGHDPSLPSSILDSIFGRRLWTRANVSYSTTDTNTIGGNSINSVEHIVSVSNSLGASQNQRTWRPMDPAVDTTNPISNNDKFQFWTVSVGSNSATPIGVGFTTLFQRDGRMYRNADDSKGIDAAAYINVSNTLDDSDSDPSASEQGVNKLNLGVGKSDDSSIRTKPLIFSLGVLDTLSPSGLGTYQDYTENYEDTLRSLRDCKVYEIIFFNRKLNNEEIEGVENYLVNKYGDPTTL